MSTEHGPQFPPNPEQESEDALVHPYLKAVQDKFNNSFPESRAAMQTVIDHITHEGIDNYSTFQSAEYPGVTIPYTVISVTPELIHEIAGTPPPPDHSVPEAIESKERTFTFLFPGHTPPRDGHVFTAVDLALDRVIRSIPLVAFPLRNGENIPSVSIVMPGTPEGMGGHVTKEFFQDVDRQGFDPYGIVYGELVEHLLELDSEEQDILDHTNILLQGVSKGAIITDRIYDHLPPSVRERTQMLLDNPAGSHNEGDRVKGAQVFTGLIGEIGVRAIRDDVSREFNKSISQYREDLRHTLHIPQDDWKQQALKYLIFTSEGLRLLQGSPLNNDNPHRVRKNLKDPLSSGAERLSFVQRKHSQYLKDHPDHDPQNPHIIARNNGSRSVDYYTDQGYHFYTFFHPGRYDVIFKTIQSQNNQPTTPIED